MAEADKQHCERTYTVAYIAHAPLEPRAAVAEWNGDKLTVWTGTQRPFGVQGELAQAFHIPEQNVRVIMPDTGSGYGGKHTGEAAIEAARLAKAAGKPVKLVWTREEEFTWAYFRPAGVIDVRSAVDKDGRLTAWEFHNYNSGTFGINTNVRCAESQDRVSPVEIAAAPGIVSRAWRRPANHFARESHMDELAALAGIEPLEFRLRNLKDERFRAVLQAAAERFGWGNGNRQGVGFGIAGGFEKGSYVATCAEVRVRAGPPAARGARGRVVRMRRGSEPRSIEESDGRLRDHGAGRRAVRIHRFRERKDSEPAFARYRVPRFRDAP